MALPAYLERVPGGIRISLHVQPRAGREGIVGIHGDALKVKVRAPALDGKANRATLDLVARTLGIPGSGVELASGARNRNKKVLVRGMEPATAARKIELALREA